MLLHPRCSFARHASAQKNCVGLDSPRNARRVACFSRSKSEDRRSKEWGSATAIIHPISMHGSDYAKRSPLPPLQTPQQDTPTPLEAELEGGSVPQPQTAPPPPVLTVYSIRLTTSFDRGSALSEMYSAVNVLLVGDDGRSVLHRISPVNDPEENAQMVEDICNVVGSSHPDVGANCLVINAMRKVNPPPKVEEEDPNKLGAKQRADNCKLRFQEGCIDEVSFLAPELGSLAGIIVGTESGTWVLDEAQVSSSRTNHTNRFVCRRKLGAVRGEGATWMTPIPEGAIVYGSGESSLVLTKDEARSLRSMDMNDYSEMKKRLLMTTFMLTAGGSGLAGMLGGIPAAWPFAAGGLNGCMYHWMLQQSVDNMQLSDLEEGIPGSRPPYVPGSTIKQLVGSPAVRLAGVAACAYVAVGLAVQNEAEKASAACSGAACAAATDAAVAAAASTGSPAFWQFVIGVMGFMTYKLALVGVALTPQSSTTAVADSLRSKANHMEAL